MKLSVAVEVIAKFVPVAATAVEAIVQNVIVVPETLATTERTTPSDPFDHVIAALSVPIFTACG